MHSVDGRMLARSGRGGCCRPGADSTAPPPTAPFPTTTTAHAAPPTHPPTPPQDAIDRAVTAAVGEGQSVVENKGWRINRVIPFNPVDKKTSAEVREGWKSR